jgi:hypothetical protein
MAVRPYRTAQRRRRRPSNRRHGVPATVRSGTTTLFFIDLMASLVFNAGVFQWFFSRPSLFRVATDARNGPPRRRSQVRSAKRRQQRPRSSLDSSFRDNYPFFHRFNGFARKNTGSADLKNRSALPRNSQRGHRRRRPRSCSRVRPRQFVLQRLCLIFMYLVASVV